MEEGLLESQDVTEDLLAETLYTGPHSQVDLLVRTSGETRLATYGDMGHSHHNNMQNLLDDCKSGKVDAIVHMGDHAYDLGFVSDHRGDAYMNAFQKVIAYCPFALTSLASSACSPPASSPAKTFHS